MFTSSAFARVNWRHTCQCAQNLAHCSNSVTVTSLVPEKLFSHSGVHRKHCRAGEKAESQARLWRFGLLKSREASVHLTSDRVSHNSGGRSVHRRAIRPFVTRLLGYPHAFVVGVRVPGGIPGVRAAAMGTIATTPS